MCIGLLPAIHLLKLADACPFDGAGGWGAVQRKSWGGTATCPQLLCGDGPHSPRRLLRFVCLLLRRTRGHGLEEKYLGTGHNSEGAYGLRLHSRT